MRAHYDEYRQIKIKRTVMQVIVKKERAKLTRMKRDFSEEEGKGSG